MTRSRGDMASPTQVLLLLAALSATPLLRAGPLGPLPNVTSADFGLKGNCALGDVVYMPGDEFPGSSPCERCTCTTGGVQCTRQVCEPRPGCKALHRPDHCCPTYQCECEQEGRVYGNGEKLVDPADPCRVCYCQGGEVVCRRIACFVRDDCTPRLVPGRCCPEYDNCPLRGVTSLPGVTSSITSVTTPENVESPPTPPKGNAKDKDNFIKPGITIKEITPVSEIPVITDVKIKEILPSPSIEVAEYPSSRSPLIPREATSENSLKEMDSKTEEPTVVEVHSSLPVIVSSPEATQFTNTETKDVESPSKISFSTQDSTLDTTNPSNTPVIVSMGVPPVTAEPQPVATTKGPIIEEEDTYDRNPAFPPLPDDLAVLRNHEDEIVPEPIVDNEHVSSHDIIASIAPVTEVEVKDLATTTTKDLPDTTTITTTEKQKTPTEVIVEQTDIPSSTPALIFNENPTVNLRSALPTEILSAASFVPEEITTRSEDTTYTDVNTQAAVITTDSEKITKESYTEKIEPSTEIVKTSSEFITPAPEPVTSTLKVTEMEVTTKEQEQTTSSVAKSNVATEVTSQTELSSLPIETSDQNPPQVPENTTNDKEAPSTSDPLEASSRLPITSSEVITVSKANENTGFENVETTEFIVSAFGSSETATDAVELIKISADPEKSAAIIENNARKTNDFTDLINLVRDVASISDNNETDPVHFTTTRASISDSEELIPVNAGYKSKNKNFNQNSITEIPLKSKIPNTVNKQRVEIEDDESEGVTDSPPPYDKVEPTTRRPIIDNVSDDVNISENKTNKKDIEIITQSYVPTINHKRPNKVVMKKSNEKPTSDESPMLSSTDASTDSTAANENPNTTGASVSGGEQRDVTTAGTTPASSTDFASVTSATGSSVSEIAPATGADIATAATAAPTVSESLSTTSGPTTTVQ